MIEAPEISWLGMLVDSGNNEYPTAKLMALGLGAIAVGIVSALLFGVRWLCRKFSVSI